MTKITVVLGDITGSRSMPSSTPPTTPCSAVAVSTARSTVAADPEILAACRQLRRDHYPDGLPTGQAVATTAGRLPARWVIHTVGPTYAKTKDKSGLFADCSRNSLAVAEELGAESVAFPAISTGVYRWPLADAARIAWATVRATETRVPDVRFVAFNEHAYEVFREQG